MTFVDLKEKVVLITGASSGIGEACARAFARRGARLILTARSADALERVARSAAPAPALVLPADLGDPEQVRELAIKAAAAYGRLDVLVNNAGVGLYVPAWRAPLDLVRRMLEVNLFAPLQLMQAVVPGMQRQGGGTIVNVSSVAGKVALPWLTVYSASKAALNSLSDGLRMELREAGIHVVSVCPGYVSTEFGQHALGGQIPRVVSNRKRFTTTPEACAEAIVAGVEKRKRTVVIPWMGWALIAAARVLPGPIDGILARWSREASPGILSADS